MWCAAADAGEFGDCSGGPKRRVDGVEGRDRFGQGVAGGAALFEAASYASEGEQGAAAIEWQGSLVVES